MERASDLQEASAILPSGVVGLSRKFAGSSRAVRGCGMVRASSRKFADGSRKFAGGSRGSRTFTITIYDSSQMVLEVLTDGSQRFAASSRKFPSVLD